MLSGSITKFIFLVLNYRESWKDVQIKEILFPSQIRLFFSCNIFKFHTLFSLKTCSEVLGFKSLHTYLKLLKIHER